MIRAVPKPPKREKRPRSRLVRKPKKRNRSAAEFKRVYGSEERVRWVTSLGCGVPTCFLPERVENAHVVSGGKGRKSDARFIAPLCRFHHQELHGVGIKTFCRWYAVDLVALAESVERRWLAYQETRK